MQWHTADDPNINMLICGGEDGIVFNYHFDTSNSTFTLRQTIDMVVETSAVDLISSQIKNSQIQTTIQLRNRSDTLLLPLEVVKTR